MHRLFIVLPVYAAVVIFLPRQDWFRPFADQVASIHPDVSFWVSMCLGAAAAHRRYAGVSWRLMHTPGQLRPR